ncbi:MAG: hypothetical protein FWK04_07280 [Nostoc sp. GBBB01]|nr:hypothetical protein [Nostoc sp. GBBB01]
MGRWGDGETCTERSRWRSLSQRRMGRWGDGEMGETREKNCYLMPHAQCPMPRLPNAPFAQCRICPIPSQQSTVNSQQ